MSTTKILITILVSVIITFGLRSIAFIIFKKREMPKWLINLGAVLPSTIMAVLIVYCGKDISNDWLGNALPWGIAVITVALLHKWKHNTFISIAVGTAIYMVLIRLL